MKKMVYGACCTLLLLTTPVAAAPSVQGSTGTINNPSADVMREGQFALGYYRLDKDNHVGVFTMGLAPRLEVGVAGFHYDRQDSQTKFNAKWSVLPESVMTPGLAIGVEDLGAQEERSAYIAASKALPLGFRIHAGVGNGRFDGGFAALEKTINPLMTGSNLFPATTLIAEYDGHHMNYGARLALLPGLKLDAGWRNKDSYIGLTFTN